MGAWTDPDAPLLSGAALHDQVVLKGVLRAKEKVRLATADLKNFRIRRGNTRVSFVTLLRDLARKGVRIEILHGGVPSEPFLQELKTGPPFPAGHFEMKYCSRVHLKTAVVDYRWLYLGSANFTGAGLGARSPDTRNFEMGLWTQGEEALDMAMALFDHVWSAEACSTCKIKRNCPDPLEGVSY
jgi:phosphatidylserine/phosphatidylglycerophosphate/cardiolipin synthase-like enzyme